MKLTIGFITAREQPHLPWLIDSLQHQIEATDRITLVVIDALRRSHPNNFGVQNSLSWLTIRIHPPRPNVWQGPHRIAPHDFFANAVARNTAICLCDDDYIAFLDDRVKLGPMWLGTVRSGYHHRTSVLCGPYDKIEDGPIDTNNVSRKVDPFAGERLSIDHRKEVRPGGMPYAPGGWLFGGNFACPLEWLLEVNGHEEGCDPTGQEDCVLGLMLANRGRRIEFTMAMAAVQDRRGHVHVPAFPRADKGISPNDRSHATIDRFGTRKHTEFTPDLRELRERIRSGGNFPTPGALGDTPVDWYDQTPIRDFTGGP